MECNSDLVDRISGLPDSVLGVILSCLPTREAVLTFLLSKSWTFLWRTVHNLDFSHEACCDANGVCRNDKKFTKFVNNVLRLHDSGLLNEFSLRWGWACRHAISHTHSWISTALKKNVHKLSIYGAGTWDLFTHDVPVGVGFFKCDSLRYLELTETIVRVSDTLVVCLPRLVSLKFHEAQFESKEACEKLLSGCPMLDNLYLNIGSNAFMDFECRISSTSLRRLEINFLLISSLKLNAASLEYLRLSGFIREIIIERNLSSLGEAYLDKLYDEDDYYDSDDEEEEEEEGFSHNSIVEAIRALSCAQVLTLSHGAMKALHRASVCLSTKFKRLVELEAKTQRPLLDRALQDIICNSDNLEVLSIHHQVQKPLDYVYLPKWTNFVEVPKCLSSSLKKVHLRYHTCSEEECEMIRRMLEHGSVLEVFEIFIIKFTFHLAQKIWDFPKKSPICEVRLSHIRRV